VIVEKDNDEDYIGRSVKCCRETSPNLLKKIVSAPKVSSVMDRLNLTDNQGVMMIGAIADTIGVDVFEGTISRSTVRRYREKNRKAHAAMIKEDCNWKNTPLVIHWDGKKLPNTTNISDPKSRIERHGVTVTGERIFHSVRNLEFYRKIDS